MHFLQGHVPLQGKIGSRAVGRKIHHGTLVTWRCQRHKTLLFLPKCGGAYGPRQGSKPCMAGSLQLLIFRKICKAHCLYIFRNAWQTGKNFWKQERMSEVAASNRNSLASHSAGQSLPCATNSLWLDAHLGSKWRGVSVRMQWARQSAKRTRGFASTAGCFCSTGVFPQKIPAVTEKVLWGTCELGGQHSSKSICWWNFACCGHAGPLQWNCLETFGDPARSSREPGTCVRHPGYFGTWCCSQSISKGT